MIGDAVDRAVDRVSERVVNILQSYALKIVFAVVAVFLLVGLIACGLVALFWLLQPMYGPMTALAIIAAGLALLTFLFAVAAITTGRKVTLAGTVQPVQVVEEEADEVVDTVGPYKFVAGALAAGALLGGGLAGGRRDGSAPAKSSLTSTAGSILSLAPTILSIVTMLQSSASLQASQDVTNRPATRQPPYPAE
ncbi:MAG: hypothetical protein KKB37_02675 [Alphaproteobacteria bacterium]|nr:hypothetical protein [Alphaproteobacteria bacterium]